MCGIAGMAGTLGPEAQAVVARMTDALRHRGPDAGAVVAEPAQGFVFGHRRLSILDLHARSNQPMASPDGRYVLTYNGEVYNYRELRDELERGGVVFQTTSDTEVVLAAWVAWGAEAFGRFRGMFALGLFDRETRTLVLARDPLGIKPLYYVDTPGGATFCSEAAPLWRHALPDAPRLESDSVRALLVHGYCPDPDRTLVEGVRKVPPGTTLTFRDGRMTAKRYWALSIDPSWEALSYDAGVERFTALFSETMRIMLRSDVPLGFLLSGGLDSSLVVAQAAAAGGGRLRAFTATFGHALDEDAFAATVARAVGAEHEILRIDVGDITDTFGEAVRWYDDLNTTDPGLFTTVLIGRAIAAHNLKVAFVGEGADEAFGGYSWFGLAQQPFRWLPARLRALGYLYATSRVYRPRYWRHAGTVEARWRAAGTPDVLRQVTAVEVGMQLPNHLLQKVDRGTMASSIEARVPFLDHEVVGAAYSMPAAWKRSGAWFRFGQAQEKRILRELASRSLPREIAGRKKRGFLLPVATLLVRNRAWAHDIVCDSAGPARDYFSARELEGLLDFRETLYHPLEKEKEMLAWRLLLLNLWHRRVFAVPASGAS